MFGLRGKIAFYLYLIVHAHEPVTDRKTSMRNPVLKLVDGLTLVLAALTPGGGSCRRPDARTGEYA